MTVNKIGPYILKRQINKGAFGQVFLVHLPQAGGKEPKVLVLKIPRVSAVADPRANAMFGQEIEIALMLVHDNIVSCFDSGEHQGLRFLVMNYVNGANLRQLNQQLRGARDEWQFPTVAHVGRCLAHAMGYAHSLKIRETPQGIVHRDLKPANVLVDGEGNALVTDFGVATAFSFVSAVASIKGTLRYMAPEQANQRASQKSDIFSMGAILHEMVEGVRFREGHTEAQLFAFARQGVSPPLTRTEPSDGTPDWHPHRMRDLIEWMLRPDEADRPTTDQVIEVLDTYLPARTTLKDLVAVYAHQDAHRTGHTLVHFQMPQELGRTLAVAQAAKPRKPDEPEACVPVKAAKPRAVSGTILVSDSHGPASEQDAPVVFQRAETWVHVAATTPVATPDDNASNLAETPNESDDDDTPMHWDDDDDDDDPNARGNTLRLDDGPTQTPESRTLALPPWPSEEN